MGSAHRHVRLLRCFVFAGVGSILVSWPAPGRAAPDARTCIAAHADGQVLRGQRKLLEARQQFVGCVADACPALVRKDCAEFLKQVETSLPSVVLAGVDAQGRDTTQISVKIDGQPAASELESTAIALDPGRHEFEFTARDGSVQRVSLVLREAEKHRPVIADFRPKGAADSAEGGEQAPSSGPPVMTFVLGGVGLAALGSYAYFAASGYSIQSELDECRPECHGEEDRISSMRTRYLIADISAGVALVSLGVGTYLWITHEPHSAPAQSAFRLDFQVPAGTRGNLGLTASGRF